MLYLDVVWRSLECRTIPCFLFLNTSYCYFLHIVTYTERSTRLHLFYGVILLFLFLQITMEKKKVERFVGVCMCLGIHVCMYV